MPILKTDYQTKCKATATPIGAIACLFYLSFWFATVYPLSLLPVTRDWDLRYLPVRASKCLNAILNGSDLYLYFCGELPSLACCLRFALNDMLLPTKANIFPMFRMFVLKGAPPPPTFCRPECSGTYSPTWSSRFDTTLTLGL